jgi:phosphoglycerate kinase
LLRITGIAIYKMEAYAMNKKSIKDVDITGKRVLVRVDFNVPLDKQQNVTDDNRIRAALPTIKYILEKKARLILMSHLGRPKGEAKPEYSLKPAAEALGRLLDKPVKMLADCIGDEVEKAVSEMAESDIIMLENLRFHKEETANDEGFAKQLASLGDIFVNDAFGTCHRAHASTEGITHYLPGVSGLLVEKEIEYFQKVVTNPEKPFVFLLGGAKVADKIPVIENMMDKASTIIIGGAMAYTFMKVNNIDIGSSRFEQEMLQTAKDILQKAKEKGVNIILPVDHIVTDNIETGSNIKITDAESIETGFMGVDIGPKTINLFIEELQTAKTIVWNGPVGIFENDRFANGTKALASVIAELQVISVIGGGDTAAAVAKFNLADKMSHISTGGGASLEYLEGKVLPGVAALSDK